MVYQSEFVKKDLKGGFVSQGQSEDTDKLFIVGDLILNEEREAGFMKILVREWEEEGLGDIMSVLKEKLS